MRRITKEFCELDSDGDGMTNGLELGDPCCEWDLATYGDATDLWPGGRTDLSTLTQPGLADEKSVVDAQNALYGKAVVCTTDQGLGAGAAEGTDSTQEQGGGADSGGWADTGTSGGNEEQGSSDTKGGAAGAGDTKSNSSSKNEGGGGFLCC